MLTQAWSISVPHSPVEHKILNYLFCLFCLFWKKSRWYWIELFCIMNAPIVGVFNKGNSISHYQFYLLPNTNLKHNFVRRAARYFQFASFIVALRKRNLFWLRKGLQTKNGNEASFQISKICDRNLPCKVDASFFVPCMNNCVVLSADRADTQIFFSMRAGWKSPHPCKPACANTWATIN